MIQLDPMNILFSYFTSINVFFMVKPIQVLTHLRFMGFIDNENHRMHDKRTKYGFKILN